MARLSHLKRAVRDGIFWGLCGIALLIVVLPAAGMIVSILAASLPVLGVNLLLDQTNRHGLQNALLGTGLLGLGVVLIGGTVGIGAGIYFSEYASPRVAAVFRFFSEVLAGIPSIVIGYVGYVTLVVGLHWGYSLLAGILALSAIVVPYIAKSTELAINQVPRALREGALALGLPRWLTLVKILLPPSFPGIFTGLLVAVAIATSETAPLLYTVGFSDQNPNLDLIHHPVGYLTYVVYTDVQLPDPASHQLANAAAAASLILVLVLVFLGRWIAARGERVTARMGV